MQYANKILFSITKHNFLCYFVPLLCLVLKTNGFEPCFLDLYLCGGIQRRGPIYTYFLLAWLFMYRNVLCIFNNKSYKFFIKEISSHIFVCRILINWNEYQRAHKCPTHFMPIPFNCFISFYVSIFLLYCSSMEILFIIFAVNSKKVCYFFVIF